MASLTASPSARSGRAGLYTPRQLQESDMATAQRTLTLQFQAAQLRAQQMAQMVPDDGPEVGPLPMGAVDAADYPSRLEYKGNLAAPHQEHMNYRIGAAIPPEIAAQYRVSGVTHSHTSSPLSANGDPVSVDGDPVSVDGEPAPAAPRQYRAAAFNDPDVEANSKFITRIAFAEEESEPKKYKRRVVANWTGISAYIFFTLAFAFYMWIRITKTLDLGPYIVYGIFVLGVEILGASTVFLYGTNLLFDPVMERPEEDEKHPGQPKVYMPYHVRVMVPCYKEDIDIVRRTIMAAFDSPLPVGCQRTIYLCDDGKDPKKRKFCDKMGPEVIYVSGRKRQEGEMNGKSGNINNCCSQIYPKGVKIPPNELVCIFDADQVACTAFFLKTLHLFDGGSDVGMVLSPQCFHNLNLHADIFNHSNVHFWEYMQPGYDALGFISCTGTNFMVRAAALREVGGSPTYTLTEDFALGMALKMHGWHCRYVQEYLAIGEAPDQIRNCYQQRSRWCKGHFQIFFNRTHCPATQTKLSLFMRLLYCSGVWSYVVGAISTPTFIIIPLITIWFGIFPIVISWWAALGLTVYMVATHGVLYYCRSPKHVEALWFANVGNQVLWWTYVKACYRALGSACSGSSITFKTTMKGAGMLATGQIRDLWMPALCLGLLSISIIYALVDLFTGATFWSPLIISIFWAAYNMIPPLLVCWYGWVSKGTSLQWLCRISLVASFCFGIGATLFMWFLYPKHYDYSAALKDSMFFYEANMLGTLPASVAQSIPWRGDAMTGDLTPILTDLTGSWITGKDAGILKMTLPIAWSTSLLAWSLLSNPGAYNTANQTARALSQVQHGASYLLKTVYKDSSDATQLVYQVGNYTREKAFWGRVEDIQDKQATYEVAVTDGASDLGGQIVASLAASSLVFATINPAFSAQLLQQATSLYLEITATANLGRYSDVTFTGCRQDTDPISLTVPLCPSIEVYLQGSAIELYKSDSYYDDLLWAAAWMYKATGNTLQAYMNDVQNFYVAHVYTESSSTQFLYNWDNMYWAANVFLAQLTNGGTFHERAQYFLKVWVCGFNSEVIFYTPLGGASNQHDPSVGSTQAAATLAALYGTFLAPSNGPKSRKYLCWARTQTRYVMGESGRSHIAGFGKNPPTHVQSMPASCPPKPLPCNFVNAFLTPSSNPNTITGALIQGGFDSDTFFDGRAMNDTKVGIETNAAFTSAVAGLVQAPGSWELCLQGYGPLNHGSGGVC